MEAGKTTTLVSDPKTREQEMPGWGGGRHGPLPRAHTGTAQRQAQPLPAAPRPGTLHTRAVGGREAWGRSQGPEHVSLGKHSGAQHPGLAGCTSCLGLGTPEPEPSPSEPSGFGLAAPGSVEEPEWKGLLCVGQGHEGTLALS